MKAISKGSWPKINQNFVNRRKMVQEQVFSLKWNKPRCMSSCGIWGFPLVKHFNTCPCPSRNNWENSKPTKIDELKQNGGGEKQEHKEHKMKIARHDSWSESWRTRWGKGLTSHLGLEYTDSISSFVDHSSLEGGTLARKKENDDWSDGVEWRQPHLIYRPITQFH
jgi:hypothetical protein